MSHRTKKQHFVPQFLLRNFASEIEKLWIYDKSTGTSFSNGVKNVGCDGYFYDDEEITEVTGESQFVENALARAEGRWSSTLTKVLRRVRSKQNASLSIKHRSVLSEMIAIQMIRTPLVRTINDQMSESMKESILRAIPPSEEFREEEILRENDLLDFDAKNFHITSMLNHENVKKYQNIFQEHIWIFIRASSHGIFYISDHPLSRRAHLKDGWGNHSGIGSPGIEISFPLAKDVILVMFDRGYFSDLEFTDERAYDALSPDMLLYYNSMQVQSSQRFLYSLENDFSHAETVLAMEPYFRDPNRKMVGGSDNEENSPG